jgi:hypothetical protein
VVCTTADRSDGACGVLAWAVPEGWESVRDDQVVADVGDPGCGPGGPLYDVMFRPAPHVPAQCDDVVLDEDFDVFGVDFPDAAERVLDPRSGVRVGQRRLLVGVVDES